MYLYTNKEKKVNDAYFERRGVTGYCYYLSNDNNETGGRTPSVLVSSVERPEKLTAAAVMSSAVFQWSRETSRNCLGVRKFHNLPIPCI